jgi:hypothetical protein
MLFQGRLVLLLELINLEVPSKQLNFEFTLFFKKCQILRLHSLDLIHQLLIQIIIFAQNVFYRRAAILYLNLIGFDPFALVLFQSLIRVELHLIIL